MDINVRAKITKLWKETIMNFCNLWLGNGFLDTTPKAQATTAAAKSLQSCRTLCDPIDTAHQAPLSLGLSRQEHWSWVALPSPTSNKGIRKLGLHQN